MDLTKKKCVPCEGGTPPLTAEQIAAFLPQVKEWKVEEDPSTSLRTAKLVRRFKFTDFKEAMLFVNAVARVAEADGHHPDIIVHYNKVDLVLWTHAIGGLSENDFIIAAKVDALRVDSAGSPRVDAKYISIDELDKVEIKMGTILTAEKVEGSDKLLAFSVDLGESQARTIVSGVAAYYAPEQMVGKQVPVITNLAPRKLRGVESNGMIIYAIDESVVESVPQRKTVMLNPERPIPPGSAVK